MIDGLLATVWAGPLLWALLYSSDYYVTIACARLYQAQTTIVFEGSYEITVVYQADVNALRRLSPRFLSFLALSTTFLLLARAVAGPSSDRFWLYLLVLGSMILKGLTIHVRHLRNWYLFSRGVRVMKGRVEYPRRVLLRVSALELGAFAALYAGLFLVTAHPFVLGGAIACALEALGHHRLAKQAGG